jgi:hypothetical protein
MLKLIIPSQEEFNEETNEFLLVKGQELQLEHSLVSLSKWESFWQKPFLTKANKTIEESIDYIRCMTITQNVDPKVYNLLTQNDISQVSAYIENPMTATTFSKDNNTQLVTREIITSEIIYYWMIAYNIPFECQKWHLNRLLTLINVCNIKNQPQKYKSTQEILRRNRELNAQRRAALNTPG